MKDKILSSLEKVKGNGTRYRAKCPAAEHSSGDDTLSLLFNDDGRTLIHCHAGCTADDVLASIGLSLSDLYPDGAIREFMASASVQPKKNKYESWLDLLDRKKQQLKPNERLSQSTLSLAKEMYLKSRQQ